MLEAIDLVAERIAAEPLHGELVGEVLVQTL
jgi:hypothetical protein